MSDFLSNANNAWATHQANIGDQYYNNGDFQNALTYYGKSLQKVNSSIVYYKYIITKAQIYMGQGQYQYAITDLNKAYRVVSNSNDRINNADICYQIYDSLGKCLYKLKEYREAAEDLQVAVDNNGTFFVDQLLLGNSYMNIGKFLDGQDAFTAAININPDNPVPYYNRAHCLILYIHSQQRLPSNIKNQDINMIKQDLQMVVSLDPKLKGPAEKLRVSIGGDNANIIKLRPNENPTKELNNMIGLNNVKQEIRQYIFGVKVQQRTRSADRESMNMVFEGNPGSGKTQVANLIPKVLYQYHILSKPVFVKVKASKLIHGARTFSAGTKMTNAIKSALGGVLFIDEAYNLTPKVGDPYDPRPEIINSLLQGAENYRGQIIIILAGYPKNMETFLDKSNPGMRSRFNTIIHFKDYTPSELYKIFTMMVLSKHYLIKAPELIYIKKHIHDYVEYMESRNQYTGNGRFARNLLEAIHKVQQIRLSDPTRYSADSITSIMLHTFIKSDVIDGFNMIYKENHIDPSEISGGNSNTFNPNEDAYKELQNMIGLKGPKEKINAFIDDVKVEQLFNSKNSIDLGNMNMVFEGAPGTGKTQVARLMAKILYQKGVIKEPKLKECGVKDLVAQYVGQTAPKTSRVVKQALGGVLFIDEAYELGSNSTTTTGGDNFNKEAIATLIQLMENHRHDLLVIMAGYKEPMENFLNTTNPGLNSRFPNKVLFPNYNAEEMYQILMLHAHNPKYHCIFSGNAKAKARQNMKDFVNFIDDNHIPVGNGRDARIIVTEIVQARNQRIIQNIAKYENDKSKAEIILPEDVDNGFAAVEQSKRMERN